MSQNRTTPSVFKIGGVALRVPRPLAVALWAVTGLEPEGTAPRKVARPVVDPLHTEQANDVRAALAKADVEAPLVGAVVGPCVIRYEARAVSKAEKFEKARKEISLALGEPKVNLLIPVPGKRGIVGIEVARPDRQIVPLADILGAIPDEAPLRVAFGRAMDGTACTPDLATMPHLLVAGATGGGKSACLNAFLVSIISRATPEEVRLLLIDPKRVELTPYADLPHLVTGIVTDARKAADALAWVTREMDDRYSRLEKAKVRKIEEYNAKHPEAPMPRLLVVIDELADLMLIAGEEVEASIQRITQLARAAGIHLIVATQRPSTDVITGVIKANIPSRLAFAVASGTDSRVILDHNGAEHLLGLGDALFLPMGASAPERVQGAWVTEEEIKAAVLQACEGRVAERVQVEPVGVQAGDDPQVRRAVELVIRERTASVSRLQAELKIGHPRAKEIMQTLESRGIVGPAVGNSPRAVLVDFE